jgi:hypothetical protein
MKSPFGKVTYKQIYEYQQISTPFKPRQEFLNDFEFAFLYRIKIPERCFEQSTYANALKIAAYLVSFKQKCINSNIIRLFEKHELDTLRIIDNHFQLIVEYELTYLNAKGKLKNKKYSKLDYAQEEFDKGNLPQEILDYFKYKEL